MGSKEECARWFDVDTDSATAGGSYGYGSYSDGSYGGSSYSHSHSQDQDHFIPSAVPTAHPTEPRPTMPPTPSSRQLSLPR